MIFEALPAEDRAIRERVQQGMTACFTQGDAPVERERTVVDFHQYLGRSLLGTMASEPFVSPEAARLRGRP